MDQLPRHAVRRLFPARLAHAAGAAAEGTP
jgi:hypothetical protein